MHRMLRGGVEVKGKYVDLFITVLYIAALVIIYFFWGCKFDIYITILAAVVVVTNGVVCWTQSKKIKNFQGRNKKPVAKLS